MLKKTLLICIFALATLTGQAFAKDTYVRGHYRKDGSYVQPHYRSAPDSTVTNNYSFEGNRNPYTGNVGNNHYRHDLTSPNYEGPDNQGRIGHGPDEQ